MSRVKFDEEVEKHLNDIMGSIRQMGIKHVSKADALRFIIRQNQAVQLKVKRKSKNKFGFIFQ